MTKAKLPFQLSPEAITQWLHSLSEKNSASTAVELNKVAKLLRKSDTDINKVLSTLLQLTPTVLHICSTLESSVITQSDNTKSNLKIIRLCIQLLRNSALAFFSLCEKEQLSTDEKNITIYTALQLIGYSQRLSTIFHDRPSSTLWEVTGKLYILALKANSSQQPVNHKNKSFKNQTTIESVIKRNILFNISNPYQYDSQQIKKLFFIADQVADKIELNPSDSSTKNTFQWDANTDTPPYPINSNHEKKQFTACINTQELIIFMQSKYFKSELEQPLISKLFDQLSGFQSLINAPIPSAPTISRLIVGFKGISEHLLKVSKLKKIEQLSVQSNSNQPIANMSLVPMTFESGAINSTLSPTTTNNYLSLLSEIRTVKTLAVKNNQFIIAEANHFNCSIGDVALFCSSSLTHKLGIIRQTRVTNSTGTKHILIEEITGIPAIHQVKAHDVTTQQLISITNNNTVQPEILIPPCKVSIGSQISCASGESFILDKLNDYSSFFARYQSSFASIDKQ